MTFSTILKWIGYGMAILSFAAAVGESISAISSRMETRRNAEALLASERIQLGGHDYEAAWRTLEQASQLAPDSAPVDQAQEISPWSGSITFACMVTANSRTLLNSWIPF